MLCKYIKKLGKLGQTSTIRIAPVFNCYTGDIVCNAIKNLISDALIIINNFKIGDVNQKYPILIYFRKV